MALQSTPIKQHNAIESVFFIVAFARGLPSPTLEKIRTALAEFSQELPGTGPGVSPLQLGGMQPGGGMSIEVPEASRFIARPDGNPAWAVQALANLVQVQCFEYTSFAEVWARARRYLLRALACVDSDMPMAEIAFQVVDKFSYPVGGDWAEYDVTELFNPDSIHLTRKARESGALWHVYQGWFEPHNGARILHQLNLSNSVVLPEQQLNAIIDHRGAVRALKDSEMLAFEPMIEVKADGTVQLDEVFDTLHQRNRTAIEDLLQPEKLKVIGITK